MLSDWSKRLWPLLRYLLAFGAARGGLFLVPLIVANSLSSSDYGRIEFAHAAGSLAAALLGLGTTGAVPLAIIRSHAQVSWSALLLHQIHLCAWIAIGTMVAWLLDLGHDTLSTVLVSLFAGSLAMQGLWSSYLKSQGRPESALLMDTGQWLVVAAAVVGAATLGRTTDDRMSWVMASAIIYACGLVAWTTWQWRHAQPAASSADYRQTLKHSLPLMTSGVLALVVTSSGRLNMGLLAGPEMTGAYAALARVAALPIVAHQLITVVRFRRVYQMPQEQLSRTLVAILLAVIACVVLFAVAFAQFAYLFGEAFATQFAQHRTAGLLILAQTVPWSAIALNDFVNSREGTAPRSNRWTATFLLVAVPPATYWLMDVGVTLERYIALHSLAMLGYFLCQSFAMFRQGVNLLPAWGTTVVAFVLLSLLSYVV